MSQHLPNYLRTFRKRCGFTQAELAYLICEKKARTVSRYEQAVGEPRLRAAIACKVAFDAPLTELFAGVYEEVELDVILRAHMLCEHIEVHDQSPVADRKLDALRRIMSRPRPARRT